MSATPPTAEPLAPLAPLAPLDSVYLLRVTVESNITMLENMMNKFGVYIPLAAALIATQQITEGQKMIARINVIIAEMEGERHAETL